MKQKFFFLCLLGCFLSVDAWADDAGLRFIKTRGEVICGTNLTAGTFASKDEAGFWRGIDADLCRVFSGAIFGRTDRFKLIDVKPSQVNSAFAHNQIDIMLGDASGTASLEISGHAAQAGIVYYVRQMFLSHQLDGATSMEDFKGKKVCVIAGTDDYYNFLDFNEKYKLDLKPLVFKNNLNAKEAFLLKRCDLYTGNELYLQSIINQLQNASVKIEILPEVIAEKPVFAQVSKDNPKLRIIVKWILNALALAEKRGIDSNNVGIFIGLKDRMLKNLLGENPDLWEKFGLNPTWVRTTVSELGNYGEIYEKNLGKNSPLKLERGNNNLIENKGLIGSQSFY